MYAGRGDGISLYAHIPFCLSKCPYCDFNTYQGIESQFGDFLTAVAGEIAAWGRALGRPAVNTIFLGAVRRLTCPTGTWAGYWRPWPIHTRCETARR